jgi:hypothetical protein
MSTIITAPISGPNKDLVKAAERFLSDVRAGKFTDAVIVATGESKDDWLYHYSVQEYNDMAAMIGEVYLFLDEMRGAVHASRQRAKQMKHAGGISGNG